MKPSPVAFACLTLALCACAGAPAVVPTLGQASPSAVPPEAILLLAPGSGSRLVGQVHVEGVADSTFEQTLVIQLVVLGDEGEAVLAEEPVVIEAELGQRGPFAGDLEFTLAPGDDRPGEIRVFSTSPRDGGIVHLTSTPVWLGSGGNPQSKPGESTPERIAIQSPLPGQRLNQGVARIRGVALASFEQTLIAEAYNVDGGLIGSAVITVDAPDLGLPGPFAVEIGLEGAAPGPCRIVVRDPSPAFGQDVHLASVEVVIGP